MSGRIVIRFGVDSGRRFVECVDDGIGMADPHIRRLFAYAGQRFADSHEFHIDRARWDEAGIQFFPNSRFGVGVLSYFMLAEELDIASRRWVPPMDLAPAPVHARIIGSGSLFRLEPVIDPTRLADDYGTSVRLYLREDASNNDTLLQSILNWLLLPEVSVTIWLETGKHVELAAGQPADLLRSASGDVLLPLHGSEDTKAAPRVYIAPCVNREHGIRPARDGSDGSTSRVALSDGIITNLAGRPWPVSLIVNLSEDLRSTLTVDRRRVDPTESEIEPVLRWVRENGGAALAAWSKPDFMGLHQTMRELHPDVAAAADAALRAKAGPRVSTALPILDLEWPVSVAGVSDLDPEIGCELLLASRLDVRTSAYSLQRTYKLPLIEYLPQLDFRKDSGSSVHQVVAQGVIYRVGELASAGLSLPHCLRQAASFETPEEKQEFPTRCGPALRALEGCGRIALREWLRWIEADLVPVFDAARAIAILSPQVLLFDLDRLEELGPLQRNLCRLSFGDCLTWIELSYFAQAEGLQIESVLALAQELSGHGVQIPDLERSPRDVALTEAEFDCLKRYFRDASHREQNDRYPGYLMGYGYSHSQDPETMANLARRFDLWTGDFQRLPNLTLLQEIFLTYDFSGTTQPSIRYITASHLYKAACHSRFGTLAQAFKVALSLADTGVDLGKITSLDDGLIHRFDAIPMTPEAALIVRRLFDAIDYGRPASVWDLALAATTDGIEPQTLSPVLDVLERCGGDVARCREFVAIHAKG